MAHMRDRLVHRYFVVDYALVWDAVRENIPLLKEQVTQIIRVESSSEEH